MACVWTCLSWKPGSKSNLKSNSNCCLVVTAIGESRESDGESIVGLKMACARLSRKLRVDSVIKEPLAVGSKMRYSSSF